VLYAVRMDVALPHGMDSDVRTDTLAREKAYSHDLQRAGEWVSIWRCVGQYSNLSIFDVADNERLHEILWNLPLFPYMTIDVTPLAQHPSDLAAC
jgi:muconolactone D-isomerase